MSPGVNAAVAAAHDDGILTSATLLANAPFFEQAVEVAASHPRLGVGAHLNLVRGKPLSPPGEIPLLVDGRGLLRRFRFRRCSRPFLAQAEKEYRRQLEKILAAGILPTHIDFEKHHAFQAGLYDLACRLAGDYGVPAARVLREPVFWAVRRLGFPGWKRLVMASALRCGVSLFGPRACDPARPDRLLGQTHIGMMTEDVWLALIAALPPGVSEVMTHPGSAGHPEDGAVGEMGASWLSGARETELRALTSERVREAVRRAGVVLTSFRALVRSQD